MAGVNIKGCISYQKRMLLQAKKLDLVDVVVLLESTITCLKEYQELLKKEA